MRDEKPFVSNWLGSLSGGNAAVFDGGAAGSFLGDMMGADAPITGTLIISDSTSFLRAVTPSVRVNFSELELELGQLDEEQFIGTLERICADEPAFECIAVDMRWVTKIVLAQHCLEVWGLLADRLAQHFGVAVISCYETETLVTEQLQAVFQAHQQFLTASGVYSNPYYLPAEMRRVPRAKQMSYLIGRVVPEYEGKEIFDREYQFAATGADPDWLAEPSNPPLARRTSQPWQIYCFGQLRVYKNGNQRVDWKIKGGAPKKNRTLFAYLLTKGENGAHADRIAELLWPEEQCEEVKRSRLHHTVTMLRRTLGDNDAIIRSGDYYRLVPPENSWVDIASFEQLCRRGVSLFRRGQRDQALQIYVRAEKLYGGDLFDDIPLVYVDDDQEDWCMQKRIWMREMSLKLQRDMSALLREEGRLREALEHCLKALAIDPTSDDANIETMKVYHAQGRPDTLARQYRQYVKALQLIDASPEGSAVQRVFLALSSR